MSGGGKRGASGQPKNTKEDKVAIMSSRCQTFGIAPPCSDLGCDQPNQDRHRHFAEGCHYTKALALVNFDVSVLKLMQTAIMGSALATKLAGLAKLIFADKWL